MRCLVCYNVIMIISADRASVLLITLLWMESCHWKDAGISVNLSRDKWASCLVTRQCLLLTSMPKDGNTYMLYRHVSFLIFLFVCFFHTFRPKLWFSCYFHEGEDLWAHGAEGWGKSMWPRAVQFIHQEPIQARCSLLLKAFTCDLDLPSLTAGHCCSKWCYNIKI